MFFSLSYILYNSCKLVTCNFQLFIFSLYVFLEISSYFYIQQPADSFFIYFDLIQLFQLQLAFLIVSISISSILPFRQQGKSSSCSFLIICFTRRLLGLTSILRYSIIFLYINLFSILHIPTSFRRPYNADFESCSSKEQQGVVACICFSDLISVMDILCHPSKL